MRWTHSLPVLDKFSVVNTLVLDNLVLLDRSSDKDCDLNLVLPVDLSGGLYEALLVDDDQERSFGGEPFERLYGIWMKSILAKTNLDYVSGYSFVGPDYLYKDKSRNLIPCEIKWKTGGLMTAIGQLTGYIRQFNAPFGILVRAGTFHPSWLYQWRMVRGAWPEEQLEKIIFLLLQFHRILMGSTPLPRELTEPDPEKVLVKEALSEAHRGIMTGEQATEEEARRLWTVLKERMLAELSVTEKRRA